MCLLCGYYHLYLRVRNSFRIVTAQSAVINIYYFGVPGGIAFLMIGVLDFLELALAKRHAEIIILALLANLGYSVLCRVSSRTKKET